VSNCDNPNIIQPGSEPPVSGKNNKGRGGKKPLPSGENDQQGGGSVVTPKKPKTFSNPITPGSSGDVTASSGTGGTGGGSGAGGGTGGGSGEVSINRAQAFSGKGFSGRAENQWIQPETEYGRIKGKEIKGEDGCKGQEKKSKEFKPRSLYPFNKVNQTESGHVFEIDDTPGSERITFFHRSGSNFEYHPNGDVLKQDVRDSYFHVFRDQYVHLGGYSSVTVDKGLKILINSDEDENTKEENVNFDIHIEGNANVNIYVKKGHMNVSLVEGDMNMRLEKGDINLRQDEGHFNHTVAGDYNLEVGGHMHVVVGGDVVNEIGGNRDERIDGDFDQKYLTKQTSYLGEYLKGEKRTYVGKNMITEVSEKVSETGKEKEEKYDDKRQQIRNYAIKSEESLLLETNVFVTNTKQTKLRSTSNFDIFACLEGGSKFNIYSETPIEIQTQKVIKICSVTDVVELLSPKSVDVKSEKIKYKDKENGEAFKKLLKPDISLSKLNLPDVDKTKNHMENNKKEWIPTNSKK
jgi:hypothetical protein